MANIALEGSLPYVSGQRVCDEGMEER